MYSDTTAAGSSTVRLSCWAITVIAKERGSLFSDTTAAGGLELAYTANVQVAAP